MSEKPAISSESGAPTRPANATPAESPTTPELLSDVIKTADERRGTAILRARAHNIAIERFERRNTSLGVPAAIIAAVVGSSIFASLSSNEKNFYLLVTTGSLSILAAVLSALQTFLKYSEIAQSHKAAKDGYESVSRRIDNFKLQMAGASPMPRSDALKALQEIDNQLDDLGKSSPIISIKLLRAASDEATEFSTLARYASSLIAAIHPFER
jgi:hypothetical protein